MDFRPSEVVWKAERIVAMDCLLLFYCRGNSAKILYLKMKLQSMVVVAYDACCVLGFASNLRLLQLDNLYEATALMRVWVFPMRMVQD